MTAPTGSTRQCEAGSGSAAAAAPPSSACRPAWVACPRGAAVLPGTKDTVAPARICIRQDPGAPALAQAQSKFRLRRVKLAPLASPRPASLHRRKQRTGKAPLCEQEGGSRPGCAGASEAGWDRRVPGRVREHLPPAGAPPAAAPAEDGAQRREQRARPCAAPPARGRDARRRPALRAARAQLEAQLGRRRAARAEQHGVHGAIVSQCRLACCSGFRPAGRRLTQHCRRRCSARAPAGRPGATAVHAARGCQAAHAGSAAEQV